MDGSANRVGEPFARHVQQIDSIDHVGEMQEVGRTLALQKVKAEHFTAFPPASEFSYDSASMRFLMVGPCGIVCELDESRFQEFRLARYWLGG